MEAKTDNELIAEFIGLEPSGFVRGDDLDPRYKKGDFVQTGWAGLHRSDLRYHTSWDWLMPVVEKIGKLYGDAFPKNEEFMKRILAHEDPIDKEYIDVISTSICTPISEVYAEVVEFIKWYNESKGEAIKQE